MIRNVILDWSGTLVDDLPAVWQATNAVFARAGVPEITLDQFRAEFCLPFQKFYDRYIPHIRLNDLEGWFHSAFRENSASVKEILHAREFLEFCRARQLRTFLVSSIHPEHYRSQTAINHFDAFLERAYIGVWDKRAQIGEILAENQLDPSETLFIGDMQHDIETARHGGIHACAVLTGYNGLGQLRASQPDLIVEHLGELRDFLQRHALELRPAPGALPEPQPVATVGALIFHPTRREVLMIRTDKWSSLWGIPGGKIKYGEPSIDALRREIQEETNLSISEIAFVMVQDCIHSTEFYRDAHFVLLNYTCRCRDNPEVKLNHEAIEFRWLPLAQALNLPLNTPTRVLLEHVTQHLPAYG